LSISTIRSLINGERLVVKRIVISSLLLLLGGIIGLASGVGLYLLQSARQSKALDTPEGRKFLATRDIMANLGAQRLKFETCPDTQDAKKTNLQHQLDTIQNIKANLATSELLPLLEVQEGIAHGQLALLEESSGNPHAFTEQMSAAREALKSAGWTDYSESNLRKILRGMQGSGKDQRMAENQ
jgi:hypothetical protein